jgi:parvulin-like peptidyl-prolyl isomerase
MNFLSRLKRPWVHFIVLGLLLFWLDSILFPPPKPVIGPLSEARLETLQQQWFSSTGRLPSPEQQQRIVQTELDRDMLFQKALAMNIHLYDTVVYQRLLRNMGFLQLADGKTEREQYEQALDMRLHLGDEVIKRRLIQIMEQLLLAANPPVAPTEEDIKASFAARKQEMHRPPRYSIEHLYFNRQREAEVDEVVATIQQQNLTAQQARSMSSPFLPGYIFNRQTPDQLARHFGASFVMNFEQATPQAGGWLGPVRSTYGLHYVWVEAIEPERDATLDEVRGQLLRDLELQAKSKALASAIETLRKDYEVKL